MSTITLKESIDEIADKKAALKQSIEEKKKALATNQIIRK
jgi:hypothetical protein